MIQYSVKVTKKYNKKKGLVSGTDSGTAEIMNLLNAAAKTYAPVDTGLLKDNIYTKVKKKVGYLISKSYYALFQEYGTKNMSAANNGKGYMRPAVDIVLLKLRGIYSKNIKAGIKKNKE